MVNPVLVNDLRKSLFRRRPVHAVALLATAIAVLTYGFWGGDLAGLTRGMQAIGPVRLLDLTLPVIAPIFTAGAFAKEFEQRTWQDVLLTRLTAEEILSAKFLAGLIPTVATMVVLFPPVVLLLLCQGVSWAQDPGPWMFILPLKFSVGMVFYLAVGLACSYRCRNAREALAVSYSCLAAYAAISFAFWNFLLIPLLLSSDLISGYGYGVEGSPHRPGGMWVLSASDFSLSLGDWLHLLQSGTIAALLITNLWTKLRNSRRAVA